MKRIEQQQALANAHIDFLVLREMREYCDIVKLRLSDKGLTAFPMYREAKAFEKLCDKELERQKARHERYVYGDNKK